MALTPVAFDMSRLLALQNVIEVQPMGGLCCQKETVLPTCIFDLQEELTIRDET